MPYNERSGGKTSSVASPMPPRSMEMYVGWQTLLLRISALVCLPFREMPDSSPLFTGRRWQNMEEDGLLERLLREQCHVGRHGDGRPGADDDDAGDGKAPIALREPREVRSDSLQSPHDPAVTGHKGKGYEVQVAETCESDDTVQMITHVGVTPSSGSDAGVTRRVIDELSERGVGPSELWCDTSYGSGRNGWEVERRGTELVSPVGGRSHKEPDGGDEPVRLTASDFYIDVMATRDALNKS